MRIAEHVVTVAGAAGGTVWSVVEIGIPNPIAVALYALISTVVAYVVKKVSDLVLAWAKRLLGL